MRCFRKESAALAVSFALLLCCAGDAPAQPFGMAGAQVQHSIIRDSIIGEGAFVSNSLLEGTLVGDNAVVKGSFQKLTLGDMSEMESL